MFLFSNSQNFYLQPYALSHIYCRGFQALRIEHFTDRENRRIDYVYTTDLSLHKENLSKLPLTEFPEVDQAGAGKLPLEGSAVGPGSIVSDKVVQRSRVAEFGGEECAAL